MIIATYDPKILGFADRIPYMEDGKMYRKDSRQAKELLLLMNRGTRECPFYFPFLSIHLLFPTFC